MKAILAAIIMFAASVSIAGDTRYPTHVLQYCTEVGKAGETIMQAKLDGWSRWNMLGVISNSVGVAIVQEAYLQSNKDRNAAEFGHLMFADCLSGNKDLYPK